VPQYQTSDIRNLAIVGHRGCGKTVLAEALLFSTGMKDRMGQIAEGTTTCDFTEEEAKRQISISPAACYCEHRGTKINIIDTPGYSEFFGEVIPCLWVADCSLLVVDANAGVEVHTYKVFEVASERHQPTIVVINKIDQERANFDSALDNIRESLTGPEVVPVQLPIGSEGDFKGVIDLLAMEAVLGEGADAKRTTIPDELADAAQVAREELIDAVAATDDELTMKYLEEGELSAEELAEGLREAVAQRLIMPVVASNAQRGIGALALADFLEQIAPTPAKRGSWTGHTPGDDEEIIRSPVADEPFAAVVFKTMLDPYVGRLNLLRVVSGVGQADAAVSDVQTGQHVKLSGLSFVQGGEAVAAGTLAAGDIGCVSKLEDVCTGTTLYGGKEKVVFDCPALPRGMHAVALEAASRADQDKLSGALAQLSDEDVGFTYERDRETGELILRGLGQLHVEIITSRLQNEFGVNVTLKPPKIAYRETITQSVRVRGRHKKQTGGRGQFGDVWIRVEPLPRGGGFEFVNEIKGAAVPTNYIPAVEKGVQDTMELGRLAGYPVVDLRVTLDDGSSHPVDSSDMAFRMAGKLAMRQALDQAGEQLLEPVVVVEVITPDDIMGDVMSDINGRRGQIQGMDAVGKGLQRVRALVPMAEIITYAADLRSLSQGRASYTMEFAHYQPVPANIAERIITESAQQQASQ